MDIINIEPTPKTPKVFFDASQGIMEISGRSIPENSIEFYKPLYQWLDQYLKSPQHNSIFNFKLEYFNTSSSKCILDIFRKLEKIHLAGNRITINWFYEQDDEDMQEAGEDYQRIINVPIQLEMLRDA